MGKNTRWLYESWVHIPRYLKGKGVAQHAYGGAGGSEVYILPIHDLGTRSSWVVSVTPGLPLPPGKSRDTYTGLNLHQTRSKFSRGLRSCGLRRRIVLYVENNVSEENATSIFTVRLQPWRKQTTNRQAILRPVYGGCGLRTDASDKRSCSYNDGSTTSR
jgi:hypothetical protein